MLGLSCKALLPYGAIVVNSTPCHDRLDAWLERRAARRIVTAQADPHDSDARRVEVLARLEIVTDRSGWDLIIGPGRYIPVPKRFAQARSVHDQYVDAPRREFLSNEAVEHFLDDIEAGIEDHDGRGFLRMDRDEPCGQDAIGRVDLDPLDRQRHELLGFCEGIHGTLVAGGLCRTRRQLPLAAEPVPGCPQVAGTGAPRVPLLPVYHSL